MSDSNNSSSGGISLLGVVFIVFLVLKLTGFIAWSWWYVTMPLWGGIALVAGCGVLWLLFSGVVMLIAKLKKT